MKRHSLSGYDGPRSDRMKLKTGERNIPSNYTHFSVSTLVHFRSIHPIHPGLFESHKLNKIYLLMIHTLIIRSGYKYLIQNKMIEN